MTYEEQQTAWESYWRRIREALDARPASERPGYHADLAKRPGVKPETEWRFPVNRRDRWYIK